MFTYVASVVNVANRKRFQIFQALTRVWTSRDYRSFQSHLKFSSLSSTKSSYTYLVVLRKCTNCEYLLKVWMFPGYCISIIQQFSYNFSRSPPNLASNDLIVMVGKFRYQKGNIYYSYKMLSLLYICAAGVPSIDRDRF